MRALCPINRSTPPRSEGASPQPVVPAAGEVEKVAHLALLVGRLLLLNGADTAQVEMAVARFAAGFGCEAHLLVSYEALLLTIVAGDDFRTKIGSRVPAMNVGMTAVGAVNRVVDDVERGRYGLAEARAALDAVEHRPPEYGRWLVVVALGLTAASLSRLFGGDWPTFAITWLAGAAGTWLRLELGRRRFNAIVIPFAAACLSGVIGGGAVLLGATATPSLCLVAPGMIIVPGVPLINGVEDMIRNHMTLGIGRLGFAFLVTTAIALGLFVATLATGVTIPVAEPTLGDCDPARCAVLGAGGARLRLSVQRAGAHRVGLRRMRRRQPYDADALRPSGHRHHRRHSDRRADRGVSGAGLCPVFRGPGRGLRLSRRRRDGSRRLCFSRRARLPRDRARHGGPTVAGGNARPEHHGRADGGGDRGRNCRPGPAVHASARRAAGDLPARSRLTYSAAFLRP